MFEHKIVILESGMIKINVYIDPKTILVNNKNNNDNTCNKKL